MNLEHAPAAMSAEQMLDEANRIRIELQERTCCVDHALHVVMICAGTFALDGMEAAVAANELERVARAMAADIRAGRLVLDRRLLQ